MRDQVIDEIIETEQAYLADLQILTDLYVKPLQDGDTISVAEHVALFSNVLQLASVNEQLASALAAPGGRDRVAAVFLELSQFLKMYSVFISNADNANQTMVRLLRDNRDFITFCQYSAARPESKGRRLNDFLIKPMQRVTKYPLLLRELAKHTDPSSPDMPEIQDALEHVSQIVTSVNEKKREAEGANRTAEAIAKIVTAAGGGELLTPTRKLVGEGDAVVTSSAGVSSGEEVSTRDSHLDDRFSQISRSYHNDTLPRASLSDSAEPDVALDLRKVQVHYFLFNDMLLLTRKKRKKYYAVAALHFDVISLRESQSGKPHKFDIIHLGEQRSVTLGFSNAAQAEEELVRITEAVVAYLEERQQNAARFVTAALQPSGGEIEVATPEPVVAPTRAPPTVVAPQPTPPPKPVAAAAAAPSLSSLPPRPKLGETEQKRSNRALHRLSMARQAVPVTSSLQSMMDASSVAATAPAGDDGDSIMLRGKYHDEVVEKSWTRSEITFVEVRKWLHGAFKLDVPRQFVSVKANNSRVNSDSDLNRALKNEDELTLDVYC
jgi:hypothetical protein